MGDDLATPFRGAGRQGDEGLAAFGKGRAVHEVVLSPDAGEDLLADAVGTDLAGQINLDGGIDRHGVGILADALRIVRPAHIVEHRVLVVVQILVHVTGAKSQTGHAATRLYLLQGVVDHPSLHQTEHSVRHRLGVEAEMPMVLQPVQDGIRNATHSDLEGSPVRNLGGDVGTDSRLYLGRRAELHVHRRVVALDGGGDLRLMDHRGTVKIRNALVHLGDHYFRRLDGRLGEIGGDVVAAIAVLVRERAVDARHIYRNLTATDKRRNLSKKTRNEAAVALRDIFPLIGTKEHTVHEERLLILRLAERGRTFGDVEPGNDVDPAQFIRPAGERLLNYHRNRGAALKEDPIP